MQRKKILSRSDFTIKENGIMSYKIYPKDLAIKKVLFATCLECIEPDKLTDPINYIFLIKDDPLIPFYFKIRANNTYIYFE